MIVFNKKMIFLLKRQPISNKLSKGLANRSNQKIFLKILLFPKEVHLIIGSIRLLPQDLPLVTMVD